MGLINDTTLEITPLFKVKMFWLLNIPFVVAALTVEQILTTFFKCV